MRDYILLTLQLIFGSSQAYCNDTFNHFHTEDTELALERKKVRLYHMVGHEYRSRIREADIHNISLLPVTNPLENIKKQGLCSFNRLHPENKTNPYFAWNQSYDKIYFRTFDPTSRADKEKYPAYWEECITIEVDPTNLIVHNDKENAPDEFLGLYEKSAIPLLTYLALYEQAKKSREGCVFYQGKTIDYKKKMSHLHYLPEVTFMDHIPVEQLIFRDGETGLEYKMNFGSLLKLHFLKKGSKMCFDKYDNFSE